MGCCTTAESQADAAMQPTKYDPRAEGSSRSRHRNTSPHPDADVARHQFGEQQLSRTPPLPSSDDSGLEYFCGGGAKSMRMIDATNTSSALHHDRPRPRRCTTNRTMKAPRATTECLTEDSLLAAAVDMDENFRGAVAVSDAFAPDIEEIPEEDAEEVEGGEDVMGPPSGASVSNEDAGSLLRLPPPRAAELRRRSQSSIVSAGSPADGELLVILSDHADVPGPAVAEVHHAATETSSSSVPVNMFDDDDVESESGASVTNLPASGDVA